MMSSTSESGSEDWLASDEPFDAARDHGVAPDQSGSLASETWGRGVTLCPPPMGRS